MTPAADTETLTRQLELATLAVLSVGIAPRAEPPHRDSPARYPGPLSESPSARERARTRNRTPVMPVLLLPLERPFIPGDMVATLRKLRESFRVVATCDGGVLDPASATVVDHVISLWRDPKGFKHAVREIVRLKPAVELYLTSAGPLRSPCSRRCGSHGRRSSPAPRGRRSLRRFSGQRRSSRGSIARPMA